jgi:hypothetical protein
MARGSYDRPSEGRGAYAKQDPLLVRWTVGRTVDKHIDPIRSRLAGGALDALDAGRAAERIWRGSQAFRDHGETSTAQVGAEWFHDLADRERALVQLSAGYNALLSETALEARRDPTDRAWFLSDVVPTVARWQAFAQNQRSSRWTRTATNWKAFGAWRDGLQRMRELGRARGITFVSQDPPALPKTVWEKIDSGQGTQLMSWFGVGKLVFFGGMTVLGIGSLYSKLRGRSKDAHGTNGG